jgi:hypothetical protein
VTHYTSLPLSSLSFFPEERFMARTLRPLWIALVCLLLSAAAFAAPARPRLVVLISIDQFRAD